jgi:hypothetical protein
MQVIFESRAPEAGSQRQLAITRLQFVLRRVRWLVPRATVRLSDVNGPRGGIDKRCLVELETDGNGKVVIQAVARDWRTAIDNALGRAARALMRMWQRSRQPGRQTTRQTSHQASLPRAAARRAPALPTA